MNDNEINLVSKVIINVLKNKTFEIKSENINRTEAIKLLKEVICFLEKWD